MPPAPFLYRTPSSDIALIFVNYGQAIDFEDAASPILEGLTELQEIIDESPTDFVRRPVPHDLIWHGNDVTLQMLPRIPRLRYQDVLAMFALLSQWGMRYGFIECDFAIRMLVPGATSLQIELGWGRFLTD